MNFVFAPRAKSERLPHAKPPLSPRHHLARAGYKHQRISSGKYTKPVCYPFPETPALAWSCVPKGSQSHPNGLPVRRARLRLTPHRTTYHALQGRVQERPEGLQN
ncbi:hypothetical protein RRG08_031440 [Elysia crispata]|uniref:Uncharacterized protein n=1 Tax=Elysia crispata TaxID=231223 RepID=A0AAE0ZMY1_9GAST|nr:hypothetical protein RRG08_031440 [Elysia crispata]